MRDDDKQLLVEEEPLFGSLPQPPSEWHSANEPLDFQLQSTEKRFLRNCFLAVSRPESTSTLSLLARLAEHQVQLSSRDTLWSKQVVKVADDADKAALIRAQQAAALSAIGRGVYAAMVETMRHRHDGLATEDRHRSNLDALRESYSEGAMSLNVDEIMIDAPTMPGDIFGVLRRTQDWLDENRRDVMELHDIYEREEHRRKGRRARLRKSVAGREKRAEWTPRILSILDRYVREVPLNESQASWHPKAVLAKHVQQDGEAVEW